MVVRFFGPLFLFLLASSSSIMFAFAAKEPPEQQQPKQIPLKKLPWQRPMLLDKSDNTGELEPGKEAKVWIDKALAERGDAAIVSGFRPSALGNFFIYRSFCDARILFIDADPKRQGKAGEFHWKTMTANGGIAEALRVDQTYAGHAPAVFQGLLASIPKAALAPFLLENEMAGALSHDQERVYVIDELIAPLPRSFADAQKQGVAADWTRRFMQNSINASNIENGKIEWAFSELAEHPLPKSHFLGAPFPYQNKLYVLNESNKGELRLVVMTPATGKIEAKYDLEIVAPFESYVFNQRRRMYTAKFAVHDGLLYCFPQASKVFCFDVAAKRVKWSMTYQMNPPLQGNLGNWKAPTAFVQDGKLVFTVSDDDYVFCTNAKDGKLLWKVASVGDLYLAGIAGDKVLLVGHNRCRALNLKDGKEAWRLQTGTPSGIGAFDNGTYLLPLKKGKDSNQPEIAYIDVNQGALVGLSPLKDAPGNLVVHGKLVLSQSATTVTGYSR